MTAPDLRPVLRPGVYAFCALSPRVHSSVFATQWAAVTA